MSGDAVNELAWITEKCQKLRGTEVWKDNALATLRMGWSFLSTKSFCWGDSTQDCWLMISLVRNKSCIKNSLPLSLLKVLSLIKNWVSMYAMKLVRWVMVSLLVFIRINQVKGVKSSTKVSKYLCQSMKGMPWGS